MDLYTLPNSLTEVAPVRIYYDVDDILHGLTERAAERAGVEFEQWTSYCLADIPAYTPEQVQKIIQTFEEPDVFYNMEFYAGAEDILRPRQLGASVSINTNSFTRVVADTKIPQLLAKVKHLQREDIISNICGAAGALKKPLDPRTLILVDDSPYNVASSPAQVNVMLRKPYNTTPEAHEVMRGKRVFQFDTLLEANQFVYYVAARYTQEVLARFPQLGRQRYGQVLRLMA